ncbi:ParB/RepB/Spo0J family partition protein [Streptomyces sp. ARC14]|uniref:ParB/RepB/Spo0J family partition protein n=1 Tax=Streptomyces sp. ARC14 TaxID=2724152 RepID=UPI00385747D8
MPGQLQKQGKGSRGGPKPNSGPAPSAGSNPNEKFWKIPSSEKDGDVLDIKIEDITPNPFNDREMGDLTHLAESIAEDGLMSEINVMHSKEFAERYPDAASGITTKYVIAFGERRWRATQMVGHPTIAAVLRNDIVPRIRRILFAENFHRKQLLPVEEAREFYRLQTEENLSIREIVAELKLSGPGYVSGRLKLLDLPDALQRIVGTEDGPGVSMAREIARKLETPDDMVRVWELVRTNDVSLKEALRRFHAGEDTEAEGSVPEPRKAGEPEPQPANAEAETPVADAETPEGTRSGNDKPEEKEVPAGGPEPESAKDENKPEKPKAQSSTGKQRSAADREASQRSHASADREMTCQAMVAQAFTLSPEQTAALFARALLAPTQQSAARARAQKWLREAGKAGFTISDTDSYFEAVLSSGNTGLINTVTITTALAACEVRARDGRRQWDVHDAEHVRLLIDVGNHHPESPWERDQLTKYSIAFPNGDDADAQSND